MIRPIEDVGGALQMGYLNGRENPELIISDDPKDTRGLLGDAWGYKLRHEYSGALIEFRSAFKSEVP